LPAEVARAEGEVVRVERQPEKPRLPGRLSGAVVWTAGSFAAVQVLTLARGVVLARILTPEDFGMYALGMAVVGFVATLGNTGISTFVTYQQDDADRYAASSFWISAALGLAMMVVLAGVGPLMGRLYHLPRLPLLVWCLAPGLFLQFISGVHTGMLRRRMRFGALAAITTTTNLVLFAVAALLARAGHGYWALVYGALVSNALGLVLVAFATKWIPPLRLHTELWRDISRFGLMFVGASLVWFVLLNLDNFLVSKVLGVSALGIYSVAYNYAMLPSVAVAAVANMVVGPALGAVRGEPARFRDLYVRSSIATALTAALVGTVLVASAPDLFRLAFGAKWDAAVVPFQILVVYGVLRTFFPDVLLPLGKVNVSFWLGVVTLPIVVAAILAGTRWGMVGVAVAACASLGVSTFAYLPVISRLVGVPPSRMFWIAARVLAAACTATAAGWALRVHEAGAGVALLPRLASVVTLSAALFALLAALLFPHLRQSLSALVRPAGGRSLTLDPADAGAPGR
jgi:O-antigen/teichoic acid export membrane protein